MRRKWILMGVAVYLILAIAAGYAQTPDDSGVGWNPVYENNFDDLLADITFFLIASPLPGAVLGIARVLTETNNGSKLLLVKLN